MSLESEIGKDIPDESEAVSRVAQTIRKGYAGLRTPGRPVGRFLLIGPNEPGYKLAVALARGMFDDEQRLVVLDLEDYAEKHQVLDLRGHNGGLVRDYVDGALTEPIRWRPATVVLLENLERAHYDVWSMLLGAFDEGQLVDGCGRTVSLQQAIFLLTTQVGYSEKIPRPPLTIEVGGRPKYRRLPEGTRTAIEGTFRPEMLRGTFIDDLIMIGWGDCRDEPGQRSET
jgi:ATP-dependent Clp protease ATP-binding subunit ClpA